jgi:LCP family protein required for cell wall assembly
MAFLLSRGAILALGGQIPGTNLQLAPGAVNPADGPGDPIQLNPNIPASPPDLVKWDGAGRVTLLLLGLDYRDWESGNGPSRSDTMILLTLDPLTKSAGILSIPRDMWVAIPGFQHGKINTAYYLGEAYKLPGGGPGLAVKTVEQFLGVPINYYAQIDFGAFVKFIDELGGVKLDVPEKITVDLLGTGFKTKKTLQPGVQVLPGEWALAYARARYTAGGDFDRAARQQQVMLAMRDRVFSLDTLPTLIAKAPTLYAQLASGIHTNLSLEEAIQLAGLAQDVPPERIQRGVLNQEYVLFGESPDKLSILIPLPDKIHTLRDAIFADAGGLSPAVMGDTAARVRLEAATVAIYNPSGSMVGAQVGQALSELGAQVVSVTDGDATAQITVIDHRGRPYLLQYLVDWMGLSPAQLRVDFDPAAAADVEIILGGSWAP